MLFYYIILPGPPLRPSNSAGKRAGGKSRTTNAAHANLYFIIMKIILLKKVQGLGHIGEVKEVKVGYAFNFLIPKGMADVVTKHSLSVLAARKKKGEKVRKSEVKNKRQEAKKIKNKNFEIKVPADKKGTLYAKLSTKVIVRELAKQGYKIDQSEILLKEPIKKIGEYEVRLSLADEKVIIKLKVKNKK